MGGEITYTLLDSNTRSYKIRLVMYRDCAGSNNALNGGILQVTVRNTCTNGNTNVTLYKISGGANGVDKTALCPGATSNCTGGTIAGLSQYVFEGNYSFPTTCNEYYIFFQIQARNAATNNVVIAANNTWFYTDAHIKFLPYTYNSSARNDNLLLSANFCLNAKSRFSFYNPDPDNDSLVYELVTPRQANGALMTYTGTPLRDSANPTFDCGHNFNTTTGVYKFLPNAVQNSLVAVKIKEYRKGVYLGYTIREAQFVVQNTAAGTCGDLSLNSIKSNFCTTKFDSTIAIDNFGCYADTAKQYDMVFCEGTPIDLDIKYLNKSKIPVNMNTYSGYGTMTDLDINKSDSIRDFKFTWASPIFGRHSVTLDVNNCPTSGGGLKYSNSVTTEIVVLHSPKLSKDTLFYCLAGGAKNFKILDLDSGVTFTWNHKTGFTYPTPGDTTNINVALTKDTTYIISYKYYGGNCTGCNNSDTLVIKYVPDFAYTMGPKTSSHCIYSSQQLTVTPDGVFPPYTYKWSPYGSLKHPITQTVLDSAAAVYINNPIADPGAGINKFYVSVTANTGCELKDTFTVTVSDSVPNISAEATKYQWCSCDTAKLSVNPGFASCGVPTSAITTPYSYVTMGAGAVNFPLAAQPNGYPCVFGNYGGPSVKHRLFFKNAELVAAGLTNKNIKDISFYINSNPGVLFCKNAYIRMACTTSDTVTASVSPTQVYYKDSLPIPNASGWITMSLSGNGYSISSTDNLIVEFCFTNPSNFWANPSMKCDNTSHFSVAYDSIGTCASTTWRSISKLRPQTRFNVAGSPVYIPDSYSWTPVGGLSNANISNPIASACMPIDYVVTATKGVCQSMDTVHLHADTSLRLTCRADTFICSNLPVQLNATYTGVPLPGKTFTFLWKAINGDTSLRDTTIINPIVQPNKTVTYVLTMSGGSCTKYDTVVITRANELTLTMSKTDPTCTLPNGKAKVAVVAGASPYTYVWNVPGNADSLTGLTIGKYKVTVTAANGCIGKDSITLTAVIKNPVLTFNKKNVSCYGGNDGGLIVLIGPTNTGPFSYTWTPIYPNKDSINNLTAGWYKVTVFDTASSCSSTDSAQITQPLKLSVNADSTNAKCFGTATGSLTSTVSGGTTAYTYAWSDATIGNNPGALLKTAGTYWLTVTDAKGCKDSSMTIINQPALLTASKTQTNILCNGASTGKAKVTISGGTKPYAYAWFKLPSPIPIATNVDSIQSQSIGTYVVVTTDSNACTRNDTFILTEPTALSGTLTIIKNSTCAGFNNGISRLAASGGVPPYQYTWTSGTSFNGDTAFGLNKGAGSVTLKDANLCSKVYAFNISEPDSIKTQDIVLSNVSCNAGSDGKGWIKILSGGTAPFNFIWSPAKPNKDTITGLTAGSYYVTIYDAAGPTCFTKDTLTITQPTAIVASITGKTNVTCYGLSNGTATASASGGTPGYTYAWDNGINTAANSTLNANNHKVIVTDSKGCKDSTYALILQPAILDVTLQDTNATKCYNSKDGQAIVNVTGGNYPFNYNWAPAAADNDSIVDTLSAGIYKVIVTDSKGCKDTLQGIVIKQPDSITLTMNMTPAACYDSLSGGAKVIAIGGSPGYTYLWNTGATIDSIKNKHAGNYNVTVKDFNNCSKSASVTINQPTAYNVTSVIDSVTCNGTATGKIKITVTGNNPAYGYAWTDGTNKDSIVNKLAGGYGFVVTDSKGCTYRDSLFIREPAVLDITMDTIKNITCFGYSNGRATTLTTGGNPNYTYSWSGGGTGSSKNTLTLGINKVTVTDRKGCKDSASVNIAQPTQLNLTFVDTQGVNCWFDTVGVGIVACSGGVYPYVYDWSPASTQTDSIADNLPVGLHSCIVTDANGCKDTVNNVLINSPDSMTFNMTLTHVTCYDSLTGKAKAVITGGSGAKTFLWSTGATADSIFNKHAGNYTLTVTDAFNCKQSKTITINQPLAYSSVQTVDSASCSGLGTGKAKITVSGNNPPYTYLWNDGTTKDSIVNKTAGIYTLITTDSKGCKKYDTVTIYQPSTIIATIVSVTHVKCFGDSTGIATASVSGGNGPYTYLWNGGGTALTKNNLKAGVHVLTATDTKGCKDTATATITQPNKLIASLVDTNMTKCYKDSNGVAIVAVTGGVYPYTYNWAPSTTETDSVVNTLKAGIHRVIVVDNNLCRDTLKNIVINQPDTMTFVFTQTQATCYDSLTGRAKVTVTGGTPTYTYAWSTGGTNDSIMNYHSGIYNVTVKDFNLCTKSGSVTITQPAVYASAYTIDSAKCNGSSTGKAKIQVAGNNAPYTYLWNDGTTKDSIINKLSGQFTVITTDTKGCKKYDTVSIKQPAALVANIIAKSDVTCFGLTNGTATAGASGGNGGFTFAWDNGANTATTNTLNANNHKVVVTDMKGCKDSAFALINQPAVLDVTLVDTNATKCYGSKDGKAIVAVTGGNYPYNYNWNPAAADNDSIVDTLATGTYKVIVTDNKNCKDTLTGIVITQPDTMTLSFTPTHVTCYGYNNGKAKVSAIGGYGNTYTYQWSPGGETTDSITGKISGTYTVTVKDFNLCSKVGTVTITQPTALQTISLITDSVKCAADTNGKAVIHMSGGTKPYSFQWSTTPIQTNSIAWSLQFGTYYVTTTDAKNCIKIDTTIVQTPNPLFASAAVDTVVSCHGGSDGKISVTATGGNGTYKYNIGSGLQTSNLFTGLSAQFYSITVTDQKGCSDTANVTMTEPLAIANNIDKQNASCKESANGYAFVTNVSGGNGGYTYQWNNGQTSDTAKLIAGLTKYYVTIRDAKLCVKTDSVYVDTNYVLRVTSVVDSADCFGKNDGSIDITPSNGVNPYTYNWNTTPVQTTQKAINLLSGVYKVTVTDSNNCFTVKTDTVWQPADINIQISEKQPLCYKSANGELNSTVSGGSSPYSYAWSTTPVQNAKDATNITSGNYTLTVTDSKGCIKSKTYFLDEPKQNLFVELVTRKELTCFESNDGLLAIKPKGGFAPFTFNWDTFAAPMTDTFITNLKANQPYKVTITDAKGCTDTATFVLKQPDALSFESSEVKDISCPKANDGMIRLNIKGGSASNTNPYKVSLNDSIYSDLRIISNLKGGNYRVFIKDQKGCKKDTFFHIEEPLEITYNLLPKDTTIVISNSVELKTIVKDTAGNTPSKLLYKWTPTSGLSCSDCPNPTATPYVTTYYTLKLVYNEACEYTLNGIVRVLLPDSLFAPTAFTPINQDGTNDVYFIYGVGVQTVDMIVFDRWGERIFRGNVAESGAGWDGKVNGEMVKPGVYTFSAVVTFVSGETKKISGSITILN